MFYSNEHEPIHVHEEYQGQESKAEFTIIDGKVVEILSYRIDGESMRSNSIDFR